jgi:predicted P-loop ATPase
MTTTALVDTRVEAQRLLEHGFDVVPVERGSKQCRHSDWPNRTFSAADFRSTDAIGLRSVNGIVVSDLDSPEAVAIGADFLPISNLVWGRASKPRAKRAYRAALTAPLICKDDAGRTLLELRVNHQDVFPPSPHESGERVTLYTPLPRAEDVTAVDAGHLVRAHRYAAAAALIARHYAAPGARHDFVLALAGYLRRCGLEELVAKRIIEAAATYARDDKWSDRAREIASTFAGSDDRAMTGAKQLRAIVSKSFVSALDAILDRKGTTTDPKGFVRRNGVIVANDQTNIVRALELMDVRASVNTFTSRTIVTVSGAERVFDDATLDDLWLDLDARYHFRPDLQLFERIVKREARRRPFHPVLDYINALQWDGVERIDRWLMTYAGAADTPLNRAIGAILLIAAVRRLRAPGCKYDELVVFITPKQGTNKSTAIQMLCADPSWFSDDLPLGVDAKIIMERTVGKWIIEAGELDGMSRRDAEHLKAWLSRQVDGPARMAFARLPVERPRQFITIGSTNRLQFLKDRTGNRRFWPVRVVRFDSAALQRDRDALWAEAAHREAAGASIRLAEELYDAAASVQDEQTQDDAWLETLRVHLGFDADSPADRIPLDDIWLALDVPMGRRTDREVERINLLMQSLGYEKKQARGIGPTDRASKKRWCRTAGQIDLELSASSAAPPPRESFIEAGDLSGTETL